MKSVIAITAMRTPNGPAMGESTDTEFHARNAMMPIQTGTTGHTSRMFSVSRCEADALELCLGSDRHERIWSD